MASISSFGVCKYCRFVMWIIALLCHEKLSAFKLEVHKLLLKCTVNYLTIFMFASLSDWGADVS